MYDTTILLVSVSDNIAVREDVDDKCNEITILKVVKRFSYPWKYSKENTDLLMFLKLIYLFLILNEHILFYVLDEETRSVRKF